MIRLIRLGMILAMILAVGVCSYSLPHDPTLSSGILILNESGSRLAQIPLPGSPIDVESIPSLSQIAAANETGGFWILNGEGTILYQANFPSLYDIDVLDETTSRFLMTSRHTNEVFYFDRPTGSKTFFPFAFNGPADADLLPNGHLLVCEANAGRVIEIDPSGQMVWLFDRGLKQPMDALRLDNGNTLISNFDEHRVLEVAPSGDVVTVWGGLDHPVKLTRLPGERIMVANSDHHRVDELLPGGKIRPLLQNLNQVKAVDFLQNGNLYICAIQTRIVSEPPRVNGSLRDTPPQLRGVYRPSMSSPWFWLGCSWVLWLSSRFIFKGRPIAAWLVSGSILIALALAYGALTQAASGYPYRPSSLFWIAVLTLTVYAWKESKDALLSNQDWSRERGRLEFPFPIPQWAFWLALPVIPMVSQYYHVQSKLAWYYPMAAWAVVAACFFHSLIRQREKRPRALSVYQFGAMTVAVPFTTGSVSLESSDESELEEADDQPRDDRISTYWAKTVFIGLMLVGAALYLIGSTSIPPDVHGDEAEVALHGIQVRDSGNWNFFNPGWYHIPNLFYLIPAWGMWLFGDNLFGIRIAGGLIGMACIPLFYLIARRLLRPGPAGVALFLFTTSSFFVHFSRIGIGYNQTTLTTLVVLYCLIRAVQERDTVWFCYAGMVSALGYLSYQASHLLLPVSLATLGALWLTNTIRFSECVKASLAYLTAFWIVLSPLIGTYSAAPEVLVSRAKSVSIFSEEGRRLIERNYPPNTDLNELLWGQFERTLLAPIAYPDMSPYLMHREYGGMLDPIPAILFTAGLLITVRLCFSHPTARVLLLWGAAILITGSALTNNAPSYQRLVALIPFLALIAAPMLHGVTAAVGRAFHWPVSTRLHFATLVLVALLIMGMNRYFHQIMSKPQHLDHWTRIARYLEQAGPTHYTYFFGAPYDFFRYGTIRFLAPRARGEDVLNPEQFLKTPIQRRGPVCFMLIRDNRRYIDSLRSLYPGGREEAHFNSAGTQPFITYVVDF